MLKRFPFLASFFAAATVADTQTVAQADPQIVAQAATPPLQVLAAEISVLQEQVAVLQRQFTSPTGLFQSHRHTVTLAGSSASTSLPNH